MCKKYFLSARSNSGINYYSFSFLKELIDFSTVMWKFVWNSEEI